MIRFAEEDHYILAQHSLYKTCPAPRRLHRDAVKHWNDWSIGGCDGAVIMCVSRELVAFLRFNRTRRELHAVGTWVAPEWRGRGIARRLWREMLGKHRAKSVIVTVATAGGKALIAALKKSHPHVKWEVE